MSTALSAWAHTRTWGKRKHLLTWLKSCNRFFQCFLLSSLRHGVRWLFLGQCSSRSPHAPSSLDWFVWTIFSFPWSSCNATSFELCAIGGHRRKRIQLAGAHVGDLLLRDRHAPKISITLTGLCPNKRRCAWHWSFRCFFFTKWSHWLWLCRREQQEKAWSRLSIIRGASAGLQPCGGKAPPVFAEYMSTTSLSIDPATAAQLLSRMRQLCPCCGAAKDSTLQHVVDFFLCLWICRPASFQGALRISAAILATGFRAIKGTASFSLACSRTGAAAVHQQVSPNT